MCVIGTLLFSAIVFASASISGVVTYVARIKMFGDTMSIADTALLTVIFAIIFALSFVMICPVKIITNKR